MITGKTETGFEFSLDDDVLDDYELLEALVEVDNGNEGQIIVAIDKLLGAEQKKLLKDHIRNKNGKVSAKAMMQEVAYIFKSTKQTKNS